VGDNTAIGRSVPDALSQQAASYGTTSILIGAFEISRRAIRRPFSTDRFEEPESKPHFQNVILFRHFVEPQDRVVRRAAILPGVC